MMVVPRVALLRVTTVASTRSGSSGKLATIGTFFRTAVDTVVDIAGIRLLLPVDALPAARILFSWCVYVSRTAWVPASWGSAIRIFIHLRIKALTDALI